MHRRLRLSGRALDSVAHATLTGALRRGSPDRQRGDRSGRKWQTRFAALRQWLTTTLGDEGFENALSFLVEGGSCREVAAATGDHASTVSRARRRLADRLRELVLASAARALPHRTPAWRWVGGRIADLAATALADAALGALAADPTGCTIAPRTASSVGRTDAWAASVAGHEERHRPLTFAAVRAYVRRKKRFLFGTDGLYLGAWRDDGQYCLDITRLFPDLGSAVAFARTTRQQAVTHLLTGQTAWLDDLDGGQRRAA